MAKPSETREKAQKILDTLNENRGVCDASTENFNTAAIVTALLYIGDQLGYLNATLDTIEHHAQRIGG